MRLERLVQDAAAASPSSLAVRSHSGEVSYRELDALSQRLALTLLELGVRAGDRVGIVLEKGVPAVAAMQAALRLGAAYVPVDPLSPAVRSRLVLETCGAAAVVTSADRAQALCAEGPLRDAALISLGSLASPRARACEWSAVEAQELRALPPHGHDERALAYILFTSGSTGVPKGVCISHAAALAFVRWSAEAVGARPGDLFVSHAPFHFDLSVFDLYAAFSARAAVTLVPEHSSYVGGALVELVEREQPTVWYSVPSAVSLMMSHGLGELPRLPMRVVCVAGEVWPLAQLQAFRARFPDVALFNWYGPTETNVCTSYSIERDVSHLTRPVPIGSACCGDEVWAEKEDGSGRAVEGETGELIVRGPTVMQGYFGQPPLAEPLYRTGDLVRVGAGGQLEFVGRRDSMVKVGGHRVELGEIEVALSAHPALAEVAVMVDEGALIAFAVAREGSRPSLLALKEHCAKRLPRYMIIDRVRYLDSLPRTRNGKVDRLALRGGSS